MSQYVAPPSPYRGIRLPLDASGELLVRIEHALRPDGTPVVSTPETLHFDRERAWRVDWIEIEAVDVDRLVYCELVLLRGLCAQLRVAVDALVEAGRFPTRLRCPARQNLSIAAAFVQVPLSVRIGWSDDPEDEQWGTRKLRPGDAAGLYKHRNR